MAVNCPCCGQPIDDSGARSLIGIRLGKQERAIILELVHAFPAGVTNEHMQTVLYHDDPNGGPEWSSKIVSILMWRVRKKVEAMGWTIPDGRKHGDYRLVRL